MLLDPWDHFRELRDTAPAVYLEQYEVYAVGRYRDVRGVLRDWQTFTSADGVAFNDLMNEAELGTAPGSDPPCSATINAYRASNSGTQKRTGSAAPESWNARSA